MNSVIIVGGGSGNRFGSEIPKQFHVLKGRPVLMHTIEAFVKAIPGIEVLVVLNIHHHEHWKSLCDAYAFTLPHTLVKGGANRFESVKNGLDILKGQGMVAVHDAVRPLISAQIIQQAFETAKANGNAVVALPANVSIRKKENEEYTVAVRREDYFLVQTPQVFAIPLLKKAYQQDYRNEFTDDASVVERLGERIHLIEGDHRNIKITFPEDLLVAEALMK